MPKTFRPLLNKVQQATRDFDMEVWKDQDMSCVLCYDHLALDDDCEWPKDPRLLLCWSCLSELCAELLPDNQEVSN